MTQMHSGDGVQTSASQSLFLPLTVTLLASVALSLAAMHYSPIIDRDGMFYINLAQMISEGRVDQALGRFDWPFYSALLAGLKTLLPFSLIHIAHALSVVFAALTCWMLVLLLYRLVPDRSIWWAVLVALCLPATNQYRPEVLRDWPAWFFMLLSVWIYLRYVASPRWRWALLFSLSVLMSALWRLDAAVIAAPLFLLSLFEPRLDWRARLRLCVVPIMVAVALVGQLIADPSHLTHRLVKYWRIINPFAIYEGFKQSGDTLAEAVLSPFSESYGATVLFVGLLALIPIKMIQVLFGLMLPYALERCHGPMESVPGLRIYRWLAGAWLLLVTVFLMRNYYVSTRYLVPLTLFLLPFLYVAMLRLHQRNPSRRLWAVLIFLIVLHGISGAIATRGAEKLAIKQAGYWVAENLPGGEQVYINDGQVSFYAHGAYFFSGSPEKIRPPEQVDSRWQVLKIRPRNEARIKQVLAERYRLIKRFDSGGVVVLVFEKRAQ